MFGSIGLPELILIFVVALLLFGPRKLPDVGRSLGRALGEFRRASNDLKRTLEEEVASDQLREVGKEVRSAVSGTLPKDGPAAAGESPTTKPSSQASTAPGQDADAAPVDEAGTDTAGHRGKPVEPS